MAAKKSTKLQDSLREVEREIAEAIHGRCAAIENVAAAVAGLAAMLLYGVKKSGEGREKGRREQAEKDRRSNAKMADDIQRVLDDPNSAFRVRKPEPGGDDTPAP